jgi:putative serine protease PepD
VVAMSDETTQIPSPASPGAATAVHTTAPAVGATDEPTAPTPPAPPTPGTVPTPPAPTAPTPPPAAPTPPAPAAPTPPPAGPTAGGPTGSGPIAPNPVPPAQPPAGGEPRPPHSPVPPPPPGRGRRAVAVLTAAGLMLVSATGGALVALAIDDDGGTTPAATSLNASPAADDDTAADEPLSQAAAAVLPSVVSIGFEAGQVSGSGSGIVISADGQILTNNHVVAQAADGGSLTVTFSDGSTAEAEIVGTDPATDLAVIQAQDVSGLTPATLGSSADLHVGDTVLAIGSPLGLDGSVSAGIVSALGRAITLQGEQEQQSPFGGGPGEGPGGDPGGSSGGGETAVIDAIQTDAAINPGNSGGALINADGEVVGINTAIASLAQGGASSQGGNIGVGFAIPIDAARDIAEQLVDTGSVTHAYLGVSIADTDDGGGALVGGVEEGQPAADAGLQEGDVITAVDDTDVSDAAGLTAAVRAKAPGDTAQVTFTRGGDEQTVDVTLGELPD